MFKGKILKVLIIVLVTAFLGELKITPFGSPFRFGLGSAGFFFLLLFYREVSYITTGFITGIITTFFRVGLDFFLLDNFSIIDSIYTHSPIIAFYTIFSLVLEIGKRCKILDSPILLGFFGAVCDSSANVMELIMIDLISESNLHPTDLKYVAIVAILRSFFVVGLFNMIHTSKLKAVYDEQKSRFQQVQIILSELFIEVFYIKKTLNEIENATAKSYELYRDLKENQWTEELSKKALIIAQEVHEIKKDNQRILAGLENVIQQENKRTAILLSEIIELSIRSNQKYMEFINKEIEFKTVINYNTFITSVYPLLIILNNLIANAIEAIEQKGSIHVIVQETGGHLQISITDNGMGISPDEKDIIFHPGYTTKFDETGKASTGIGLSHVKSMVKELNGKVCAESKIEETTFTIILPITSIGKKGSKSEVLHS